MWEEIVRLAVANGLWAVLFCVLFAHQIKDSKKREIKYTEMIASLGERLKSAMELRAETRAIKSDTAEILKKTAELEKALPKALSQQKRKAAPAATAPALKEAGV